MKNNLIESVNSTTTSTSASTASPTSGPAHGISTQCVHSGEPRRKAEGAVASPIYSASTFAFESTDELLDFVEGRKQRPEYARYGNPNEQTVEAKIATLEGAEDAILYASGMAAIAGVLMSRLSAGDEVVFFDECYHRSREFCSEHLSRFGIVTREVLTGDFEAMAAAITPNTKMLVSESPTNPHLTCIDLQQFADLGKRHGVETLIDAKVPKRHFSQD